MCEWPKAVKYLEKELAPEPTFATGKEKGCNDISLWCFFVKTPAQMCIGDHRLAGLLTLLHCSLEKRIFIKEGICFLVLVHRYEKEILKGVIITAEQCKCRTTIFKRQRTCY